MTVFVSNAAHSDSILSAEAFATRRANIAAKNRERLARERADAATKAHNERVERYHAALAFKEANNGMPMHLANELQRIDLTAEQRASVEDEITAIVSAERRVVSFRLAK